MFYLDGFPDPASTLLGRAVHRIKPLLAHGTRIGPLRPGHHTRETERVRTGLPKHVGVGPALQEHSLFAHRLQAYSCCCIFVAGVIGGI